MPSCMTLTPDGVRAFLNPSSRINAASRLKNYAFYGMPQDAFMMVTSISHRVTARNGGISHIDSRLHDEIELRIDGMSFAKVYFDNGALRHMKLYDAEPPYFGGSFRWADDRLPVSPALVWIDRSESLGHMADDIRGILDAFGGRYEAIPSMDTTSWGTGVLFHYRLTSVGADTRAGTPRKETHVYDSRIHAWSHIVHYRQDNLHIGVLRAPMLQAVVKDDGKAHAFAIKIGKDDISVEKLYGIREAYENLREIFEAKYGCIPPVRVLDFDASR